MRRTFLPLDAFFQYSRKVIKGRQCTPDPPPRRARPVAELPLVQLLERIEDLTKGWLLALIEDAPLDQAGAILAAGLVREGPRLCEGVLRALTDDEELRALDRGGQTGRLVFQAGELAGAADAEEAVRAIDALGSVIWAAALASLPDPEVDQVARLAERLGLVLREVRAAAVRRYAAAEGHPRQRGVAGRRHGGRYGRCTVAPAMSRSRSGLGLDPGPRRDLDPGLHLDPGSASTRGWTRTRGWIRA